MTERLIVRFKPWHAAWVLAARSAGAPQVTLNDRILARIEASNSWTGVVDGEPLIVAGTMQQWPGRHIAWAYLRDTTGPHMTWITLATRRKLAEVQGRIELTVRADFPQGHRWARILGFEVEAPCLKQYGPEGEDHTGYARIN